MPYRAALIAASLCLSLAMPGASGAASGATEAPSEALVWLTGTFGAVLGGDPERPATAAPDDRPLATWMREEPLELSVDPPLGDGSVVSVTAIAADGATAQLPLEEARWLKAPAVPGLHTLVATIERNGAEPTRHAWLLDVADRPGSWETLLEMPALDARLVGSAGSVLGERGRGCLAGFCQEVGFRPPADTLEPLVAAVGETLVLELSDGSALSHWQGKLEPQEGTGSETRFAGATFDEPVAGPVLSGLEPNLAGEWLLEVRADYDRERGWQWYVFRLVAE